MVAEVLQQRLSTTKCVFWACAFHTLCSVERSIVYEKQDLNAHLQFVFWASGSRMLGSRVLYIRCLLSISELACKEPVAQLQLEHQQTGSRGAAAAAATDQVCVSVV
jgi:hypothetical protein